MYYRIAIQVEAEPAWQWKSSTLCSLNVLLHWLQVYRVIPYIRLRVFVSASADALRTPLVPAAEELLWTTSVTVRQFLEEHGLAPCYQASADGATRPSNETSAVAAGQRGVGTATLDHQHTPALGWVCSSTLDRRRDELESGAGGAHDCPYTFSLPRSMQVLHAWVCLRDRVQHGDLEREVMGA
jgi:hypothetical protein